MTCASLRMPYSTNFLCRNCSTALLYISASSRFSTTIFARVRRLSFVLKYSSNDRCQSNVHALRWSRHRRRMEYRRPSVVPTHARSPRAPYACLYDRPLRVSISVPTMQSASSHENRYHTFSGYNRVHRRDH